MRMENHIQDSLSFDILLPRPGQGTKFDIGTSVEGFARLRRAPGSPYGVIQQAALHLLGGGPGAQARLPGGCRRRLFVTGHSLGAALAALFATKFCQARATHYLPKAILSTMLSSWKCHMTL